MMCTTRKIETEDTGVLNFKWGNGAIGSMAVTMLTILEIWKAVLRFWVRQVPSGGWYGGK